MCLIALKQLLSWSTTCRHYLTMRGTCGLGPAVSLLAEAGPPADIAGGASRSANSLGLTVCLLSCFSPGMY
jgi:hypothetical protein